MNSVFKFTGSVSTVCKRDLGIFAPAMQKVNDPIQQLFLDKVREFKSKSTGKGLVEPSPELQKELDGEKARIYKQYHLKVGEDLTKFPTVQFSEPQIVLPTFFKNA